MMAGKEIQADTMWVVTPHKPKYAIYLGVTTDNQWIMKRIRGIRIYMYMN